MKSQDTKNDDRLPYRLSPRETETAFQTSMHKGLLTEEVTRRREVHGWNEVKKNDHQFVKSLLRRIASPLVIILTIATLISLWVGEISDAIIIGVVILFDMAFGSVYESYSIYKIELLKKQVPRITYVLRDCEFREIPSRELVPGDICILRSGLRVPADLRLVTVRGLRVDESVMTGEPGDVEKTVTALPAAAALGDQRNIVFGGTVVTSGTGQGIVVATGVQTVLGELTSRVIEAGAQRTPLERRLHILGIVVAGGVMIASAFLFVGGLLRGETPALMFRQSLTLAVSAIPEGLTLILTLTLAIGARRLLSHGGVVRHLTATETLGDATVVCVDKTGTLTTGQITLARIETLHTQWAIPSSRSSIAMPGEERHSSPRPLEHVLHAAVAGVELLYSGASGAAGGSSLDRALVAAADAVGIRASDVRQRYQLLDTLAFQAVHRLRATLHTDPTRAEPVAFVTGAPDVLLPKCVAASDGSKSVKLSRTMRDGVLERAIAHAREGKHVLALAQRSFVSHARAVTHDDIHGLTFLALLVFHDPVRPDAEAAVRHLQHAGVRVMLLSGDHRETAIAVARTVGILLPQTRVLEGVDVAGMPDGKLSTILRETSIIARVDPLQKERIVRILQEGGAVVGMVGDGVNDAVALRRADLGIAVGTATDVAKDASDLVLVREGVGTLTAAVREGRRVRETVRTVLSFLFSTNITEVLVLFGALFLGVPFPFLPAMLLWINIVTDGTADLALALEPASTRRGDRLPGHHRGIFRRRDLWMMLFASIAMGVPTLLVFLWVQAHPLGNLPTARTVAFLTLASAQLFAAFSYRSLDRSLFSVNPFSNPWLLAAVTSSFALLVAAVQVPFLRALLGTVPLPGEFWAVALGTAFIAAGLVECRKFLLRFISGSAWTLEAASAHFANRLPNA